jgi:hypothetical protein
LFWLPLDARKNFEMTGNPIYVWEEIASCRSSGAEVPEWCLQYLTRVGKKLIEFAHCDSPPAKDKIDHAIAVAMQMTRRGRGNVFRQFRSNEKKERIYRMLQAVNDRIKAGEMETYVHENVAKQFGSSKSEVRRLWVKFISEPH